MPLRDLPERHAPLYHRLGQARLGGRVAHAYLFTGDQMEPLVDLATAWCQACLCPQPTANGDACGTCRTCRQLGSDTYPYRFVLRPESKSRKILIEEIRGLEHRLYLKSEGDTKLGIILEADRMAEPAQNAFLKTLEEPAANTMLLLLTTAPANLLSTIRSRCQQISLLENRVVYKLADQEALVNSLATMRRGAGANVAVQAASALTSSLKSLQKEAEKATRKQVRALRSRYDELEASERKRIDGQCEAIVAAAYLNLRDHCLSAVHAWFAQEYLRANNVPMELAPNPELYAGMQPPESPPVRDALRSLQLTEALIESLRFNVDEALAVQDYCQKICARN